MQFSELVPIDELQALCESFTALTGMVTAILDLDGNILVATGWQDICKRFHRVNAVTASRCRESDTILAGQLRGGEPYNVYKCQNGLVDVAVPILIGGEHLANFFTGQFFFESPDVGSFLRQADEFGFDRNTYLGALHRVPVFSETQIKVAMEFLTRLARMIGEIGLAKKRLEDGNRELARSNADLEQFAHIASHDLKTPLRNIVSYAQLLDRDYKGRLDSDADAFLGFIIDGAKQMTRLIGDFLDYLRSASTTKPLRPIPAAEAVTQALANLRFQREEIGAEISVGPLPVVKAEFSYLVSLFQNLLGNAMKYRSAERPLVLSVTAGRVNADQWRFAVADNGIGIEARYFDRIFEIFQRLDACSKAEGTGVGLTLCRRIVQRFGGTIWLESTPDVGTTFFFILRDGTAAGR